MENTTRRQRITAAITEALTPSRLEVIDQSQQHAGHGNVPDGSSETHLHIIIQAESLVGKSRVAQHRAVMDLLRDEFDTGLHALSIEVS